MTGQDEESKSGTCRRATLTEPRSAKGARTYSRSAPSGSRSAPPAGKLARQLKKVAAAVDTSMVPTAARGRRRSPADSATRPSAPPRGMGRVLARPGWVGAKRTHAAPPAPMQRVGSVKLNVNRESGGYRVYRDPRSSSYTDRISARVSRCC